MELEGKSWKKVENLHHHERLTVEVRGRLRKLRGLYEKKIITLDVLLEKPIKGGK